MNHLAPHYVNEHQSDMRGIKDGWYAMEKDGNLVSGPFSSREDCWKLRTSVDFVTETPFSTPPGTGLGSDT
jgi:hypothetical protein